MRYIGVKSSHSDAGFDMKQYVAESDKNFMVKDVETGEIEYFDKSLSMIEDLSIYEGDELEIRYLEREYLMIESKIAGKRIPGKPWLREVLLKNSMGREFTETEQVHSHRKKV